MNNTSGTTSGLAVQPVLSPGAGMVVGELAPSEQVVLRGEAFAPAPGRHDKYTLLGTQTNVAIVALAKSMFAAAILAAEKAGEVRLEIRKKPRLFGLLKSDSLFVIPGDAQVEWPAGSVESAIKSDTVRLSAKKPIDVERLVYIVMGTDYGNPYAGAIYMAYRGLAGRNLINIVTQKKLKIFTSKHYELPEATAALAAGLDLTATRGLLDEYQKAHPAEWQLLMTQIEKAIKARTEEQDSGGD